MACGVQAKLGLGARVRSPTLSAVDGDEEHGRDSI